MYIGVTSAGAVIAGLDGNDTTVNTVTVAGSNLLCSPGSNDIDFGNNVKALANSTNIFADGGINSAGERDSFKNAVISRINTCAVNGYSASSGGAGVVNIIAPISQGATPNGQAVARTGFGDAQNLAAITTANMGTFQMGTSSNAVTTSTANMSGGRDAIPAGTTLVVRKGVGTFSRTDIVPSNNSYPKAAGRSDCLGTTCTWEEEMTNLPTGTRTTAPACRWRRPQSAAPSSRSTTLTASASSPSARYRPSTARTPSTAR
jgi:type IV pilus assembly protein PilY1